MLQMGTKKQVKEQRILLQSKSQTLEVPKKYRLSTTTKSFLTSTKRSNKNLIRSISRFNLKPNSRKRLKTL